MEGLAQGTAEVPLGVRRRLIEPEGSRIRPSSDAPQQNEAKDSLVVDAAANCVEVTVRDRIMVHDTKDRTGRVLRFTPAAWREFCRTAQGRRVPHQIIDRR